MLDKVCNSTDDVAILASATVIKEWIVLDKVEDSDIR